MSWDDVFDDYLYFYETFLTDELSDRHAELLGRWRDAHVVERGDDLAIDRSRFDPSTGHFETLRKRRGRRRTTPDLGEPVRLQRGGRPAARALSESLAMASGASGRFAPVAA